MDCFCKEIERARKTEKDADAFMPMMHWYFKRIGEVGFAINFCPTCGKDIRVDDLRPNMRKK